MSSEMPTDQAIKALQAQNAQFQEMFLNLDESTRFEDSYLEGQEEEEEGGPTEYGSQIWK